MHVNLNFDISYCCRTLACAFLYLPTIPAVALHYCQCLLVRKLHSILFGPINWLERAALLGSPLTVYHQPSSTDSLNKPELCCVFQSSKFLFLSWPTCKNSSDVWVFHSLTTIKGEKTLCSQLNESCCMNYCLNYFICIFMCLGCCLPKCQGRRIPAEETVLVLLQYCDLQPVWKHNKDLIVQVPSWSNKQWISEQWSTVKEWISQRAIQKGYSAVKWGRCEMK